MTMQLCKVRHNWPAPAGFDLDRPRGALEYILLHFHNSVELYFDGRWHNTQPGSLIIFSPSVPHRFISRGTLIHDWMHLSGNVAEEIGAFGLKTDVLYSISYGQSVTERIARLETEFFANNLYWEQSLQAVLTDLWITIAREINGRLAPPVLHKTVEQLQRLRTEMILHPELPWTNGAMARQLNISQSRLYPLYRRLFSISPGRDLILMRVEKAKTLLYQGATVSQAAEMLNYCSIHHFIRQFKQVTGCTPGKWREQRECSLRSKGKEQEF